MDKNKDIKKIEVSNYFSGKKSFKHFIGYKDVKKIIPLCIFKMCAYRRDFDETKYMSLLTKFWKNIKIVSKKNLIVNQYTMKNIKKLK